MNNKNFMNYINIVFSIIIRYIIGNTRLMPFPSTQKSFYTVNREIGTFGNEGFCQMKLSCSRSEQREAEKSIEN